MAGTLTISTLSDGTNSTSSTNCIQGSCKAWVKFNSSGTILGSYNVSSITVITANKQYRIAFTNAMSNANYVIVTDGQGFRSGSPVLCSADFDYTPTTTNFQTIYTAYNEGTQTMSSYTAAVFSS